MSSEQPPPPDEREQVLKPLVLVVDDDHTHQKMMELLADRLGIKAFSASSCAQAVEALEMFSFDIILMDYRMPEVDGFACTQKIRVLKSVQPDIPIIAVTAHVTEESRLECLNAGLDDFLAKPFTFEELHEKLCFWLQKRKK